MSLTTTPNKVGHSVSGLTTAFPTILLFGYTGSGKTALIGELAEHYYLNGHKTTRLYGADKGGWETILPYVELGVIEVVPFFGDVWNWIDHAVQGHGYKNGQWITELDPNIALYAFEGLTSLSDELMGWMAKSGLNIGGGGSFSFVAGTKQAPIKVGTNNMAHYAVAQRELFGKAIQSQSLPATVLWTAGDKRGEDDSVGGVVGPQLAGKAFTGEVPRAFKYTFRTVVEVNPGEAPRHVLYLMDHIEMNAGMAKGIANARIPLAGADAIKIPPKIEPASLVEALKLLEKRQDAAKDAIKRRLGL